MALVYEPIDWCSSENGVIRNVPYPVRDLAFVKSVVSDAAPDHGGVIIESRGVVNWDAVQSRGRGCFECSALHFCVPERFGVVFVCHLSVSIPNFARKLVPELEVRFVAAAAVLEQKLPPLPDTTPEAEVESLFKKGVRSQVRHHGS
ncbi:hypothetical protein [Agromyces sp. NPDC055661]